MESQRPESQNGKRRPQKNGDQVVHCAPRRMLLPPPPSPMMREPASEVKLAAVAVGLNIRLRSADMAGPLQECAFRCARALIGAAALDDKNPNPTRIAMFLKKEFDRVYGVAWHCIVGKSFGSFVTHSSGGFVFFSADNFSFLLFKTEVRPLIKKSPALLFKH